MSTSAADVFVGGVNGKTEVGGDAKIRLGIMTWNFGNASPGEDWVEGAFPSGGKNFDLIVMGMQESTWTMKAKDISASATANKGLVAAGEGALSDALAPCVGALRLTIERSLPEFEIIQHCRRVQMQLYVLVRKPLTAHIHDVEFRVENTGFMHLFPNKGGLLLSFSLFGTKLAFLTCHLAAHEGVKNCQVRNDSIKEILASVRVLDTRFDVSGQVHHMFWMGDMNYRLTNDPAVPKSSKHTDDLTKEQEADLKKYKEQADAEDDKEDAPDAESASGKHESSSGKHDASAKKAAYEEHRRNVTRLLLANEWEELLKFDELNREIRDNRALKGFTALQPSFPPTFKRGRHISIQDPKTIMAGFTTEEGKDAHFDELYHHKRTPSYTDRILHRSMPRFERNLITKSFVSLEHLDTSDHKPVRAEFELQLTRGSDAIRVPQIVQEYLDTNQATNILKNKLGVELVVSNMRGINLAEMDVRIGSMGGLSDPYIVATTDPANLISTKKLIHSSTIKHNINPVWPAEEKIKIPLVTNDLDGLSQNGHLLLSVWDYDFSNDDDLIGLCRIPLEKIVEAFKAGKPLVFNEALYENGEIQGHLTGEISITGTYSKVRTAFESSASTLVPLSKIKIPEAGFGCCSIA